MEIHSLGRSIQYGKLKPASLFVFRVDEKLALGFRLAQNEYRFAAVTFTHPPSKSEQLPSLVTDSFFKEDDPTVFEYEMISISPGQEFSKMQSGQWPAGVFISTTDGHFLSCVREGKSYNVNWSSGEIDHRSQRPAYWTPHWKISDRFGNAIAFGPHNIIRS